MQKKNKKNKTTHELKSKIYRIVLMVFFSFILYYMLFIFLFLSLIQTVFILVESKNNLELSHAQNYLRAYMTNILHYLDYSSEQKPFPFSPFPKA